MNPAFVILRNCQNIYWSLKKSVHFINAHNFLLTMFRESILHDMVNNNVSLYCNCKTKYIDTLLSMKWNYAKMHFSHVYLVKCIMNFKSNSELTFYQVINPPPTHTHTKYIEIISSDLQATPQYSSRNFAIPFAM